MTEQQIVIGTMQLVRNWHTREFRSIDTDEQLAPLYQLFMEAWQLGLIQNQKLSAQNLTESIAHQWFANNPSSSVDHDWNELYEPLMTVWKAWSFMAGRQCWSLAH